MKITALYLNTKWLCPDSRHNQKELVMVIAKEQIDEEDILYHIRKGGKYTRFGM